MYHVNLLKQYVPWSPGKHIDAKQVCESAMMVAGVAVIESPVNDSDSTAQDDELLDLGCFDSTEPKDNVVVDECLVSKRRQLLRY